MGFCFSLFRYVVASLRLRIDAESCDGIDEKNCGKFGGMTGEKMLIEKEKRQK